MNRKLHIANIFFEWELENQSHISLREAFYQHEIYLQLQFLPALYTDDSFLATDPPSPPIPHCFTEETLELPLEIESWGYSLLIAEWADKKNLAYSMPDWQTIIEVNSKQFSFEHSPKLPGAVLLTNESEAERWLHSFPGTKVLKTCFGVSGKGHLILEDSTSKERIDSFLRSEWKKNLPVIAEPWVERILDFSTQWYLNKNGTIDYLGATICQNDSRGKYQSNTVGEKFPFLDQHKKKVQTVLSTMLGKGYYGNVGIDAMLYKTQDIHLHPVVEINARKTMGYAALCFQQKHYPDRAVRFSYVKGSEGILPNFLVLKNGRKVHFSRNLMIDILNQSR